MTFIATGAALQTFFAAISPADSRGGRRKPFIIRFIEKIRVGAPDQCWEFTCASDTCSLGYGRITRDGRRLYMHRVAYELAHGAIPATMQVLHRCDNPRCCNPGHLFAGTQAVNLKDMRAKGRMRRQLRRSDVLAIDAALRSGASQSAIARQFDVNEVCVRRLAWGATWSHVTGRETPRQRVEARSSPSIPAPHVIVSTAKRQPAGALA